MGRVRSMHPQDIEWLNKNYETTSAEDCAKKLNVSIRTVFRWADELGLKKKEVHKPSATDHQLRRKDCLVKKCCLICEHWKDCDVAQKIDGFNACKLVCFDFELNKELMIE